MTTEAPTTPTRLEDLKPKMQLTGTVKKVELFGAFVDVGVKRDGLVHISALSAERVNNVADKVKEGDTVTVWVRKVDTVNGRLDLTMIQPLAVDWSDLKRGQVYTGKVTKIERFGAFVDIGAERPGMVHISELATYRVENVTDVVKVGDEVRVQVLSADPKKKQIKLSIKALELADQATSEDINETDDNENLSAMQIAFKKAMSAGGSQKVRRAVAKAITKNRQAQEEALNATLANKRK